MTALSRVIDAIHALPKNDRESTSWIVLTGAPGGGKSSVLAELTRRDHKTSSEQARSLLESKIDAGETLAEIARNPGQLVDAIFERNWNVQTKTPREQVTIFDRALPDVLAIGLVDGVNVLPYVARTASFRFATAMLFEQVGIKGDSVSYHTASERRAIESACEQIYLALGTKLIKVGIESAKLNASIGYRIALVETEKKRIESAKSSR